MKELCRKRLKQHAYHFTWVITLYTMFYLHFVHDSFMHICNVPTDASKNLGPILESFPMARATSDISAPVASHTADNELMLEILWAKKALAASLESSELHVFVVMILSRGIQCSYTQQSSRIAFWPSGVSSPPINTRSAPSKSSMAVPSDRNSGFDNIW